MEWT